MKRIVLIDGGPRRNMNTAQMLTKKDALTPVLEDIAKADGLVLGSPIYFGDVTGQMRAFLDRLAFPWLSYNDYSMTAPKQMPVMLIETKAYTGPVRLIHGSKDTIVPMSCSDKFVETYTQDAELIVVEGENHMITKKLKTVVSHAVSFFHHN